MRYTMIIFLVLITSHLFSLDNFVKKREFFKREVELMQNYLKNSDYTKLFEKIEPNNTTFYHGYGEEFYFFNDTRNIIRELILFDRDGKNKDMGLKYLNILKKMIVENIGNSNEERISIRHIFFDFYFRWLIYNVHYRDWLIENILFFWDYNVEGKYYAYREVYGSLARFYLFALLDKPLDLNINLDEAKRLVQENYNEILKKEVLILYVSEDLFDKKSLKLRNNKFFGDPPYYGNYMYLWDWPFLVLNRNKNRSFYRLYYKYPNVNQLIEEWSFFCSKGKEKDKCKEYDYQRIVFDWKTPLKNKTPFKFEFKEW